MTEFELRAFNVEISNGALKGKDLPKRLKVLNWGKNETTDGDVYLTDQTTKVFDAIQKETGRDEDVALDFDHCTVPGSKEYVAGKPKSIAAYGDPELIKGDGLYLTNLEWTPLGKEKARNYKDLSPAVSVTKDGVVTGLHSAALTPTGAVHGLKFYSAKGFPDMIKKMTVGDKGASNAKPTSSGFEIDSADDSYNKGGANAGVKKIGNQYVIANEASDMGMMSADDKDHDASDEGCLCAKCMDADDHYSKYGDVDYADKDDHKYPIETEKHVKAAWSYINMPKNASKYDSNKLSTIKGHIKTAAKKFGVNIAEDNSDKNKTKTMSANSFPIPDAYKAQPWYNNTMNDSIIKKMSVEDGIKAMASDLGMENESDAAKVIFAFLAKYLGEQTECPELINKKDNTDDGGLKQFNAEFVRLNKEIESLKKINMEQSIRNENSERELILSQATKQGKILPLSADAKKSISLDLLKDMVENCKKSVPMELQLKALSAEPKTKKSREEVVAMFNEQIAK